MRILGFVRCWSTALALSAGLLSVAQAGLIRTQVGIDDGFGLGVASGDEFFVRDLVEGAGLAEWHEGGFTTQLNSKWSGALTSARLEVFSGGWGLYGPAEVLLNGTVVGQLTVADFEVLGGNYAFLDSFDLGRGMGVVNGLNDLQIRVAMSTDVTDPVDTGVLGYARLILRTDDAGTPVYAVPEPASLALAGIAIAIAGAALARSRRRRG